jgi:hypothetical protein
VTTLVPSAYSQEIFEVDQLRPVVFRDGLRCVGVPTVAWTETIASGVASLHVVGHGGLAGPGSFYYELWSGTRRSCLANRRRRSTCRSLTW